MLAATGRTDEALQCLRAAGGTRRPELMRHLIGSLRLLLEHQYAESKKSTELCIRHFTDPEPIYYMARHLVQLGEPDRALEVLNDVVNRGFLLSRALTNDPWLAPLRPLPAYDLLLRGTRSTLKMRPSARSRDWADPSWCVGRDLDKRFNRPTGSADAPTVKVLHGHALRTRPFAKLMGLRWPAQPALSALASAPDV